MEGNNENRSKWIKVRLKPSEEKELNKRFGKSTFRNLSEYGRAMILGEPVTIIHRDKAMDDILEELILLKRELNYIGNNLNQVLKNINAGHGNADPGLWMSLLTLVRGKVEPSILQIKQDVNRYADLWSQKLKVAKA